MEIRFVSCPFLDDLPLLSAVILSTRPREQGVQMTAAVRSS